MFTIIITSYHYFPFRLEKLLHHCTAFLTMQITLVVVVLILASDYRHFCWVTSFHFTHTVSTTKQHLCWLLCRIVSGRFSRNLSYLFHLQWSCFHCVQSNRIWSINKNDISNMHLTIWRLSTLFARLKPLVVLMFVLIIVVVCIDCIIKNESVSD